ncbi:MAG TPA: PaaI family thioesterase [Spirochaetota bacterium]|nr:PaaI family thioesterase [Spirochaetota bacterium]
MSRIEGPLTKISETVLSVMTRFIGKNLGSMPFECVTRWLDAVLVDVGRGRIELDYTVRPEMTNPAGYLHGGIQAAMLDDAMGTVCATLGYDTALLTVNMTIDYLGTARKGDTIRAVASVFREGKNLIHLTGELSRGGEPTARAQCNVLVSGKPVDYIAGIGR